MISLHIIYLSKKVLFPHCTITVELKRSRFLYTLKPGDKVIVYPVKKIADFILMQGVATLAEIVKSELSNNKYTITFKGIKRVTIDKRHGIFQCSFTEIHERAIVTNEVTEQIRKKSQELIFLINVDESDKLIHLLNFISDAVQLSDFIANYFILDYDKRVMLLNNCDVSSRIDVILALLNDLIKNVKQKREKESYEKENISG